MNPLLDNQVPQNSYTNIIDNIRNSGGPQRCAENLVQNNPTLANQINGMINQCNALRCNPRDFAINTLQQAGYPMDVIMSVASMVGAK